MPKDRPPGEPEFVDWHPGGDAARWSPELDEQAAVSDALLPCRSIAEATAAVHAFTSAQRSGPSPTYPPGSPEGGPTGDPTFMDWDGNQQRAREGVGYPHPTIPGLRVISLRGRVGGRLLMVEQVLDEHLWVRGGDGFREHIRRELKARWGEVAAQHLLDIGDLHWIAGP